jgi:hypothetical protein
VAGFIATVIFLFSQARKSADPTWQRFVYVFGGIEAVVFTAVGWLFGREVNRQQAVSATNRADKSDAAATTAIAKAADLQARGRAAKAAIDARRSTYSNPAAATSRGFVGASANAASADITELSSFMNDLFPD